MRAFSLIYVVVFLFSQISSAAASPKPLINLPSFLLGTWSEADRKDELDQLTIAGDLRFELVKTAKVGQEGTDVPYPTVCRYRQAGVLLDVTKAGQDTIDRYTKMSKKAPAYTLHYLVRQVELVESKTNSENCAKFVDKQKQAVASAEVILTWSLKDLADDVLTDTLYDQILIKRK